MSRIVIVGEAWGKDEAVAKRPFVGASGRELNRMLEEAGLLPPGTAYNLNRDLWRGIYTNRDATFKAAVEKFGEQGVVDLIAVNGYYVLVSMILNVDRTPIPGGGKPPLPVLK